MRETAGTLKTNDRSVEVGADTTKWYLTQVRALKLPVLKKDQERSLFLKMETEGSSREEARNMLIKSNLRLVVNIAKRYIRKHAFLSFTDLISAGNIGLLKAIDRFDLSRNTRFSTCATYWIKQAVEREIANNKAPVRTPIHRVFDITKYKKAKTAITARGGAATSEEIAVHMSMSEAKVKRIKKADMQFVSLDQKLFDNGSVETMQDCMASPRDETPHHCVVKDHSRMQCIRMIDESHVLTPQEKAVIFKRFGIKQEGSKVFTLEKIGQEFGITRERVRQIEECALEKLREAYMPMFEDMRGA